MTGKNIHIIGIGGTGMNGIAQLAVHAGYQVSGSDRAYGLSHIAGQASLYSESLCSSSDQNPTRSRIREARPTTQTNDIFHTLENTGITLFPQDGSGITADTDFVVYSTAIESDNPDIQQSNLLGIPLLHRADMLAKLCEGKEVIAVAGTAGKSTVTGLLGWIFQCLELDPTVYCGAPVLNWKPPNKLAGQASRYSESLCNTRSLREACPTTGNVRFGTGPWIIEADESDKSFLKFHPKHAIITNIAEDHFPLAELHKLFTQFESQVSGVVIKKAEVFQGLEKNVPMLGKHNLENAANALTLCKALGLDMQKCMEALHTFKGVERRLERHGPKVIDDFAHSPIKIAAALEAVSGIWPAFNVVWRPHGFTPLFQGLEGFIAVFSKHWKQASSFAKASADRKPSPVKISKHWKKGGTRPPGAFSKLFILPVYYAGGTVEKKITSEQFVERLQAVGVPAEFVESFQTLEKRLLAAAGRTFMSVTAHAPPSSGIEDDAPPKKKLPVLIMGARDPELPRFARRLASKLK